MISYLLRDWKNNLHIILVVIDSDIDLTYMVWVDMLLK
jgi:hypothetical protein